MKFVKIDSDQNETFDAFHHVKGVTEKDYPTWLKSAVKAGNVYVDDVDGQRYIKGELNSLTGEHGRSTIFDDEWVILDSNGGLTPYPSDHFFENYTPAE